MTTITTKKLILTVPYNLESVFQKYSYLLDSGLQDHIPHIDITNLKPVRVQLHSVEGVHPYEMKLSILPETKDSYLSAYLKKRPQVVLQNFSEFLKELISLRNQKIEPILKDIDVSFYKDANFFFPENTYRIALSELNENNFLSLIYEEVMDKCLFPGDFPILSGETFENASLSIRISKTSDLFNKFYSFEMIYIPENSMWVAGSIYHPHFEPLMRELQKVWFFL